MQAHLRCLTATTTGVILLATAGCGNGADDQGSGPPPIDIRPVSSSADIDLPLARYAASEAEERAYFAAVNRAQRACARVYGVESDIPVAAPNALVAQNALRRYGVVDAEEVERYGYLPPPSPGGDDGKAAGGGWKPSAREVLVMNGVAPDGSQVSADPETGRELPKGGCSAEGFREIDEDDGSPAVSTLVEDLLTQAWELTMADPRALAAAEKWSACMADHGYDFSQRWEAGNSVGDQPQEVKLQMAKLDLACAGETDYIGVWHAVDAAYQERLIERHHGALEASVTERQRVLERARAILTAGR